MSGFQPVQLAYNTFEPTDEADATLAPVVFCHGGGASKENWGDIPQTVANETKRRVYAVDARNHGDSEWSDSFNFDINADDLIHFLKTNGIDKAILVGHSMGGIMVMRTALKMPEKVKKLIVEDMYVKKIPNSIFDSLVSYFTLAQNAIEAMPEDLDEDGAKKFVMDYIHAGLPQEVKDLKKGDRETEDDHIANLKRDENGRFVFKTNLAVLVRTFSDPETVMSEAEGLYEGPTCFICGTLSPFNVIEEMEHIKQFFPNVIFEGVDDATHTVHADKSIAFIDAVLRFIE